MVKRQRTQTGRSFQSAAIHAAPGLHSAILNVVEKVSPISGRAVDLGSGSGALSLALSSRGFDVTAVDLDPPQGLCVRTVAADLCRDNVCHSLGEEAFDLLVAVEVMEHMENPLAFLRNAHTLARPGAKLIMSTPNVLHLYSRIKFLVKGTYWLFDRACYYSTGHIMPLPRWLLEAHLEETGWQLVAAGVAGDLEVGGFRGALGKLCSKLQRNPGSLGISGDGSCLLLVAQKAESRDYTASNRNPNPQR